MTDMTIQLEDKYRIVFLLWFYSQKSLLQCTLCSFSNTREVFQFSLYTHFKILILFQIYNSYQNIINI